VLLWPVLPGAILMGLLRAVCLRIFTHLGEHIIVMLHGPESSLLAANKHKVFAEKCFYAVVHIACTIVGGRLCWNCGWLSKAGDFFFELPWPHDLPASALWGTRDYYALEGALALESTYHLVGEVQKTGLGKNFMMFVHHAVTLTLITASWQLGILETGAVVLWLHAASDVGIDLLKASDSVKSAWDVPCFAFAILTWVGFRFILLPYHLLRPGWYRITQIVFGHDCSPYPECPAWGSALSTPEFIPGTTAWLGLCLLCVLHAIWLKQLIYKALEVLKPAKGTEGEAATPIPDMCAPGFEEKKKA